MTRVSFRLAGGGGEVGSRVGRLFPGLLGCVFSENAPHQRDQGHFLVAAGRGCGLLTPERGWRQRGEPSQHPHRAVGRGSRDGTWEVVDVTAVHEEMPVLWVAKRGQVAGERHAGSDVAPEATCGGWGEEEEEERNSLGTVLPTLSHTTPLDRHQRGNFRKLLLGPSGPCSPPAQECQDSGAQLCKAA